MSPTYSVCKNHGYLAGEVYTCPHCGEKTEVYSRITGYYRPVQNWNDGKAQEFKDRKVYDIGRSHLRHTGPLHPDTVTAAPAARAAEPQAEGKKPVSRAMLFVSATCPNCRLAKNLLQKAGYVYKEVLASDNVDLANKYGIRQAPTLVVLEGENFTKYKGVSEIRGMLTARDVQGDKKAI